MSVRLKAPLILASNSPRRKQLLKQLKIPFKVLPSHVSEESTIRSASRLVQALALRKAQATAALVKKGIVLGADTVVVLGSRILGKPIDAQDAYRMLYRLSGSTHRVLTGVAVVDVETGKKQVSYAVSRVKMKKLPLDELVRLSRLHLDKAGSYAIQDKNDPIARVISGSYDNVVGLPIDLVKSLLKPFYS